MEKTVANIIDFFDTNDFVVTGDTEDCYYVVDEENRQFYVKWEKEEDGHDS